MQRFALFNFQGMDNPIMFGITFSVGIIVVVNYVAHHGRISWVELIYVALSGFMVLRSGSRGALLSLLVTVLVMLGFISRISIFRKSLLLGVLLIIGAAVYVLTPDSTISFYADTLTEESLTNIDGSVGVRVSLWRSAYQDFLENPILGAGFGNSSAGGYPHNIILELAGEMGLIGFAIFSLMVFASLRNAIGVLRKYGRREQSYLVSTGVLLFLYFLIEALFSGYITQQLGLFMCMGILASATYIREVTGDGVGHR
jgi:O-antigen ligase